MSDECTNRICFDRYLPGEVHANPGISRMAETLAGPGRAAFWIPKLWPSGTTIRVAFMGGSAAQQAAVVQQAPEWCKYANLKFEFGSMVGSMVRITFNANDGAWSYLGKDALGIPANQPTMNLGWIDGGVILHEFGHACAAVHEHQNPRGTPIPWNKPAVNAALSGSPNFWNQATIDNNMYAKYAVDQINGGEMDRESIMLYSFPAAWTLDGTATPFNTTLSAQDRQWAMTVYPGAVTPPVPPTTAVIPVQNALTAGVAGKIGTPVEEDTYSFTVALAGKHTVETLGTTDVFLSVLDASGVLLASKDDNGASDRNASITMTLAAGTYKAKVRHYSKTGTGDYSIRVIKV